jgi:hypothetical protein
MSVDAGLAPQLVLVTTPSGVPTSFTFLLKHNRHGQSYLNVTRNGLT